jgi:hypothetical protein
MQPRRSVSARDPRRIAGPLVLSVLAIATFIGGPVLAADIELGPAGSAMRMYRDPQSGELGSPPPGAFPGVAERVPGTGAMGVEDAGAEAVRLPGGGVKINLRGRFRSAVTRHLGPSGPTGPTCTEVGAAADE